jgi:hypothetical protein
MPAPTPNAPSVALARLAAVTGANDQTGESITVHFNPASLQLQVSNELKDTKNNERKQYVAKTSAKLTMDLHFDTTDTGEDVTQTTRRLQAFLVPPLPARDAARQEPPPPLVLFEWGTLRFKGIAENYRETIDFFSPDGVPLRASVNLTLSRQDQVFDQSPGGNRSPNGTSAAPDTLNLDTPSGGASGLAKSLGAPGAARALAAANGQENLRFGAGGSLSVSGGVTLKAAAAFSAGAGAGTGLSLGASPGVGVGALRSPGGGGMVAGLAATARLSAAEGAFSGLRASTSRTAVQLEPGKLLPRAESAARATDRGARFQVGGKAAFGQGGGLRADVGAGGSLSFFGG